MNFRAWWTGIFKKDSQVRTLIAMDTAGRPAAPDRNYVSYADEGYGQNVIAFRCVNMIATAVSRIPLCLYKKTGSGDPEEVLDHPFIDLMKKPNPLQNWHQFVYAVMSYLLIDGNEYIELANPSGSQIAPPVEMWAQSPQFFKIQPGMNGLPAAYNIKVGSREKSFPVDILGRSNIIHMKTFNPLDPWYGLAPMKTAAYDIDQLNEQNKWNFSLLKRGCRPSLAFVIQSEDGRPGKLTPNQREKLREDIDAGYAGAKNAGRPLILEGGMDVKELSMSPKDVEFPAIKKLSQKDVALVFGVPGQLVGVEGSLTYANMGEAKVGFYNDTAIPHAENWVETLNSHVLPRYSGSENLFLGLDRDRIEALAPERDARWTRAEQANFLTTNEKRTMVDFGRYEAEEELTDREPGDVILVPTMQQPLETAAAPALEPEDASDYEESPASESPDDEGDDGNESPDPGDAEDDQAAEDEDDGSGKARAVKHKLQLINLPSKPAKIQAAKLLDAMRERHENKMARELLKVFMAQKRALKSAFSRRVSRDLVELLVHTTLEKSDRQLEVIFKSNLRAVCESVGRPMLAQGKSLGFCLVTPEDRSGGMERKDSESVWEHSIDIYVDNEAGSNITRIQGTTKKKAVATIRETLSDYADDPNGTLVAVASALEEQFETISSGRAMTIARTETHNAASYATRKAAESLKVPNMTKEWVPITDKRTRDGHAEMADYGPIEMHEKFQVEGDDGVDDMEGPGDQSASAGNTINCRCVLVFDTGSGDEGETD